MLRAREISARAHNSPSASSTSYLLFVSLCSLALSAQKRPRDLFWFVYSYPTGWWSRERQEATATIKCAGGQRSRGEPKGKSEDSSGLALATKPNQPTTRRGRI